MTQIDELLRERSQRIPIDDAIERHALDQARRVLHAAAGTEPAHRQRGRASRHFRRDALIAGVPVVCARLVEQGSTIGVRLALARQWAAARSLWRRNAASTVCSSRIAIVIGPTPPGTGVISEARSTASSKTTSPMLPGL